MTLRIGAVAEEELHPQRVDPGAVHLEACLDAVDHIGADVECEVDGSVVVAREQRPSIEGDTVHGVAREFTERVGVDGASDERCDVVDVGEGRVVGDLEGEHDRVGHRVGRYDGITRRWCRGIGFWRCWHDGQRRNQLERVTVEAAEDVAESDVAVGIDGETLCNQFQSHSGSRLTESGRVRDRRRRRRGRGEQRDDDAGEDPGVPGVTARRGGHRSARSRISKGPGSRSKPNDSYSASAAWLSAAVLTITSDTSRRDIQRTASSSSS